VIIEKHALAIISIIGSSLDMLGALYLAYDLLGGEHGPLRILTRGVTYGALFGTGYGLVLGPVFGLTSGAAHGITLAWELSRAARQGSKPGFWYDLSMSAIRGCGFALGTTFLFGAIFGIAFGTLSTLGQVIAYQFGMRPTVDYAPSTRLGITRRQLLGAVNRTVGYAIAGYISASLGRESTRALHLGLETGLLIGVVTVTSSACRPLIEWTADHLPARTMGVVGVGFILIGFTLQSIQYWAALLDVTIR